MKKEDFVKLGIDEETAKKCETASQEELKGYIPKARFDEVNNEKKKLELDVRDRDGQLETLKNSTGDVDAMKKQIEDLQKANKDAADAHAAANMSVEVTCITHRGYRSSQINRITQNESYNITYPITDCKQSDNSIVLQ